MILNIELNIQELPVLHRDYAALGYTYIDLIELMQVKHISPNCIKNVMISMNDKLRILTESHTVKDIIENERLYCEYVKDMILMYRGM